MLKMYFELTELHTNRKETVVDILDRQKIEALEEMYDFKIDCKIYLDDFLSNVLDYYVNDLYSIDVIAYQAGTSANIHFNKTVSNILKNFSETHKEMYYGNGVEDFRLIKVEKNQDIDYSEEKKC